MTAESEILAFVLGLATGLLLWNARELARISRILGEELAENLNLRRP